VRLTPALAGALLATAALAQPVQPTPTVSAPVSDLLAAAPQIDIGNGQITARIAAPDPAKGFYRGTRFDQAGVITSLKLNGREFYGPWFDRTAPEVLDYAYDAAGAVVAGPDSATSGPVEEFAPLDFTPAPNSRFIKIGVGLLAQPDDKPYDHYRHYRIIDGGKRQTRITKTSIAFTQALESAAISYVYEKTLRLVPGKPQLVIEHRLKNTGTKPIITSVYDHNFLRLVPSDAGIQVTFPFPIAAATPPAVDLMRIRDNALTYLRPMAFKERISFPITGFGPTAADYDIKIMDTKSRAGVTITGDQPLTKVNVFSIDKVQSVEPYIAIELAPGAEKRWTYTYIFKAKP
jgi:hypothetical protein